MELLRVGLDVFPFPRYLADMAEIVNHCIPVLSGFSGIAERYQAVFCDVWGVLHDGRKPYEGVCEALVAYRQSGGRVLLLSNAPRPHPVIQAALSRMGVPDEACDGILTSGDAARSAVASGTYGRRCYHIGPPRDLPLLQDLDIERVPLEAADFVLLSGLVADDTDTVESYAVQLDRIRARQLRLICANPDQAVNRGARRIPAAGAVAARYEKLGGEVIYFGKPHLPFFDAARQRLTQISGEKMPDSQILMIGDGVLTDIKGANNAGIDALYITGGIGADQFGDDVFKPVPERVTSYLQEQGCQAVAAMGRLVW